MVHSSNEVDRVRYKALDLHLHKHRFYQYQLQIQLKWVMEFKLISLTKSSLRNKYRLTRSEKLAEAEREYEMLKSEGKKHQEDLTR
ncbi:hypothetical protein K7X08_014159 [Anisodus acutangulus]|uniref:Uncharacterized protein n=1 Tax=Anisodus acutangulus TaxID=402998 RepID=A0A9Q1LJA4_9SOLA|nr:hypothetical protein K7X08_014159 [Anisodus acutangulus]